MHQCQLPKAHCRLETNLQCDCLPRKVTVELPATLSAVSGMDSSSNISDHLLQDLLHKANATLTPHQGSSVSTGSCLWKHLFSCKKKINKFSQLYATVQNYIKPMSNFYWLLHKPVGTAVGEGAQENTKDCKPMVHIYCIYIYMRKYRNVWENTHKTLQMGPSLLQSITLCPLKWAVE